MEVLKQVPRWSLGCKMLIRASAPVEEKWEQDWMKVNYGPTWAEVASIMPSVAGCRQRPRPPPAGSAAADGDPLGAHRQRLFADSPPTAAAPLAPQRTRNGVRGDHPAGLVVRILPFHRGCVGSIPGQGTKILHATWYSQKLLKKKEGKSIGKVLGTEQLLNNLWLLLFSTALGQEK